MDAISSVVSSKEVTAVDTSKLYTASNTNPCCATVALQWRDVIR
jgi:hypothetical protein